MKQKMMKAFDEAVKEFGNVETFVLMVSDGKKQLNNLQGKCKKVFAELIVESPEMTEIVEDAMKNAKVQIKINELLAEAKKQGFVLPEMDDDTEVEAAVEAEEKE